MSFTSNQSGSYQPIYARVIALLEQSYTSDLREKAFKELWDIEQEQLFRILSDLLTYNNDQLRINAAATYPELDINTKEVYSELDVEDILIKIRTGAAELLLRLDTERGLPLVLPLLEHSHDGIRSYICNLLYSYGDDRAVTPLIKVIQTDPSWNARLAAAWTLREIGDERALPALTTLVETQYNQDADVEVIEIADMAAEAIQAIIARPFKFLDDQLRVAYLNDFIKKITPLIKNIQ